MGKEAKRYAAKVCDATVLIKDKMLVTKNYSCNQNFTITPPRIFKP